MHKKFQPLKFLSKEFLSNTPAVVLGVGGGMLHPIEP